MYHYSVYGDPSLIGQSNSVLRELLASPGGTAYTQPGQEPRFNHCYVNNKNMLMFIKSFVTKERHKTLLNDIAAL